MSDETTATGESVVKTAPPAERLGDIINVVADRIEPIVQLWTTVSQERLKEQQAQARFQTRLSWVAVAVIALIVGTSAFFAYSDKLDGSTFAFLMGTVVGYVLTFLRGWIVPNE